ncbi:hypothetical protein V2J09_003377 [Rumex salicifolius]
MDPYEATKVVFSRIQNLDPENASKIMGLLLIQDNGEKEMIRLAFGPENLLHSLIIKAKQELGISPNTPLTTSTPLTRQSSVSSSSNSSRLFLPNGLKIPSSLSISSLASPSSASSPSWASSSFPDFQNPDEFISPNSHTDLNLIDEMSYLQEQLSFLGDPNQDSSSSLGATWGPHRRSCSVSDINMSLDDESAGGGGLGWKNCMYFARGFCKNGSGCRFSHDGLGDLGSVGSFVGSPSKIEMMEQCHELLRSKSLQQQRLMAAANNANSSHYSGSKLLNLLVQQQQNESQRAAAAAALIMGEDIHKFSRSRLSRSDHMMNGGGQIEWSPSSRQIYLTFPADSTFREEDVSNYFSAFGPVQDVRIPYQQKRMFGFVTFVYPETVKLILAKGNPHFVCDSRVLVKPYKEKGRIPDKFRKQPQQLQQMERGDFSACNSPTALDPRDPFDNQIGSRMMYNNTQELLWRKKLEEEADLQQAIELQSRRILGLQLDLKRSHHRALSAGAAPFPSPTCTPNYTHSLTAFDRASPDDFQAENGSSSLSAASATDFQLPQSALNENSREKEGLSKEDCDRKESPFSNEDGSLAERLEHNLPDSPFASPTKAIAERLTAFNNAKHSIPAVPTNSSFDLSPINSRCFQMPSFSSGFMEIKEIAFTWEEVYGVATSMRR